MTTPHRATPEQWKFVERFVEECGYDSCLLELRDRLQSAERRISELESAEPQITPEEAEMIAAPWSLITPEPQPAAPAAQAVMVAATRNTQLQADPVYRECVAAALEALADQVVPADVSLRRGMRPGGTGSIAPDEFKQDQRAETRRRLLAIAAELRGLSTSQEDLDHA